MTYQEICTKLALGHNFALARYGDGEMLCASGAKGENCDKHQYYPGLGHALRKILNKPQEYVMAAQPKEHGLYNDAEKYPQDWTDADVMHRASERGEIRQMVDALSHRKIVVIGNANMQKLNQFIRITHFIEVPMINAWAFYQKFMPNVLNYALKNDNYVFLFMSGMVSNVLIDKCYRANKNNTYLDCGSVFDPYIGRKSRKYHQNINPEWIR